MSATKKMKITRQVQDAPNGAVRDEAKVVEIALKPHWKKGTKITFEREGDRLYGQQAADVVFVLDEKAHARFARDGDNLVHKRTVSLAAALLGAHETLMTLDNRQLVIDCSNEIIHPGMRKVVRGEGMPRKGVGAGKGDLVVEFNVLFPRAPLSAAQKQKVREANLE